MKLFTKRVVVALCALTTLVLSTSLVACKTDDKCAHEWGEVATQVVKDATCMEKGEELWTCGICGEEKIVKTDKKEHNLDDGIVAKEPTCSATGTLLKKCMTTDCTYTKTEAIEKTEHKRVDVAEVKPTCTTAGATAYAYCSDCKTYLVPKTVLSALGHQNKTLAEVPAMCTEPGKTSGLQCLLCEEITQAQVVVPATGHREVSVKGYPASCGTGLTDGIKCGNCDTWLVAQQVIPSNGAHPATATRAAIPATCTSVGATALTYCTTCGQTVSGGEEIPMLAHNVVNGYCTVCNTHEHTMVTLERIPATCTQPGKTVGRYCTTCDYVESEQITIPALGHGDTYQYGENVAATCTTAGSAVGQKCVRCDAIVEEAKVIPATGHTLVNGDCTACDYKHTHSYSNGKCKICNYACEHNYWRGKCDICGYVHKDHDLEFLYTTHYDCPADDIETYQCKICRIEEDKNVANTTSTEPHTLMYSTGANTEICAYCMQTKAQLDAKGEDYIQ